MENDNYDENDDDNILNIPNFEEYEDSINESFRQQGICFERRTDVGKSYTQRNTSVMPDTLNS